MGYAIIKEREYYAIYDGKKRICTTDTKSEAQNELDEYLKGGKHEQEKTTNLSSLQTKKVER